MLEGKNMSNKIKDGKEIIYHDNQKVAKITSYKNGKLNGEERSYYPNGNCRELLNNKNGEIHGEYKRFYSNGVPEKICTFKEGVPTGSLKWFWEDGSLKEECFYVDGDIKGEVKHYLPNGYLWRIEVYNKEEYRAEDIQEDLNHLQKQICMYLAKHLPKEALLQIAAERILEEHYQEYEGEYLLDLLEENGIYLTKEFLKELGERKWIKNISAKIAEVKTYIEMHGQNGI